MDADAFGVVTGANGEETSTPRCIAFDGEVEDGDKVLEKKSIRVQKNVDEVCENQMPGIKFGGKNYIQPDEGERFEEAISGWCVLSAEKPDERATEVEAIEGGAGEDFVRWKITTGDSGRGEQRDRYHIMVWGQ